MRIEALPADEAAVERYVESLWIPYHRDLAGTVGNYSLADDVDVVAEETEFRLDRLEDDDYRLWVAVDDVDGAADDDVDGAAEDDVDSAADDDADTEAVDIAAGDGTLVGFVTTNLESAPTVFDRPDRLMIGDFYVDESHRGTGLARDLFDRAVARANELDCEQLTLNVDVGNERAQAFYEKVGFEPYRRQLVAPVDDVE